MPSNLTQYIPGRNVLQEILERTVEENNERMVHRGKFYLSAFTAESNASLRRPIFQYWGHNVIVASQEYESERDGYWCYATHKDFDLIPDTTDPLKWPEYERTDRGWKRIPDHEMLEARKPSIDLLKFDWSKAIGVTK